MCGTPTWRRGSSTTTPRHPLKDTLLMRPKSKNNKTPLILQPIRDRRALGMDQYCPHSRPLAISPQPPPPRPPRPPPPCPTLLHPALRSIHRRISQKWTRISGRKYCHPTNPARRVICQGRPVVHSFSFHSLRVLSLAVVHIARMTWTWNFGTIFSQGPGRCMNYQKYEGRGL